LSDLYYNILAVRIFSAALDNDNKVSSAYFTLFASLQRNIALYPPHFFPMMSYALILSKSITQAICPIEIVSPGRVLCDRIMQ